MRAPSSTVDLARTLRREMTLPEVLLWQALRRRQLNGLLFRRQHPVGPYVLDFYCPAHRLAVEVDGAAHDGADRAVRDRRRDAWLGAHGIRVMRVPAVDVLRETSRLDVLATIAAAAASSTALSCGSPPPPGGGG
jgi:very-short-patch-repair endonuclease